MKQRSRRLPIGEIIVALAVLTVFIVSVRGFARANKQAILERNSTLLQENTEHHAKAVADILKSRQRFVENLAVMLELTSEGAPPDFTEILDTIEENTFIDDFFFVAAEGVRLFSDGRQWELQETEFYREGMKGKSGITELKDSVVNPDKQSVFYYAPVLCGQEVCGVIVGCNYYESFDDLYEMTAAEAYLHGFLMDKSGRVLLSNRVDDKKNAFEFLQERMDPEKYQELLACMEENNTVCDSYRGDYGEGLVCFSALGINDWYVLQLFPSARTAELVAPLNRSAYILETAMVICLILALGYILYLIYKRNNQKTRLMELALEALADAYPRISRINYRTGQCVFIKDKEKLVEKNFHEYDWKKFRTRLLETIHPEDLEKFKSFSSQENMRRVREQGNVSDTCIYRRMFEGEYRWIQTVILPVDSEADCVLMYAGKVDEAVKAEELYKAQLWENMQRVKDEEAAKSEFLKYMSQNLKIPVNAMIGMASLANEAARKGEMAEAENYLGRVDSLGNYMLALLEDMMRLGVLREQQVKCNRAPLSVRKMLDGYREYCAKIKQTNRNIRVNVECDERLKDQYMGDEARIMQVLHALLCNAFQFCDDGGCVTLKAQLEREGENSDCVSFAVFDTGKGISEEFKPFLFEPFAKENSSSLESEPGTGLGLPFAKLAVDSMGGRIQVESVPEGETGFTAFLELEHMSKQREEQLKPCRILLVDDNDMTLERISEILGTEGYETVCCNSAAKALQAFFDSEPGYFQVLLTDIRMPEMDGSELTARVRGANRSDSKSICILAMMSGNDAAEREKALKNGAEELLEKPFRITLFQEFLQKRGERGAI